MNLLRLVCAAHLAAAVAAAPGCARDTAPPGARPWRDFVRDLADTRRLADWTNIPGAKLVSSYDPTGGNDDFNHFKGPGRDPGWVVLADLQGPGVVRRFWTTGVERGHFFRLYFDGERRPRVAGPIDELFGERFPFTPPLARYLNLCWYSYVPLTFQKSLRIETQAPPVHPLYGPRRLFYQVNVETFSAGGAVQTFPATLSGEDRAALEEAGRAWRRSVEWPSNDWAGVEGVAIPPGESAVVLRAEGPGVVEDWSLEVRPADPAGWTQRDREYLLQDAVLRVAYDDAAAPSVEVPVGNFFANEWRERHYGTLMMGSGPAGYRCRWPMPFRRALAVSLANGADRAIVARCAARVRPGAPPGAPFLHAEWRRSGPENGAPHVVAEFKGPGLFAGCLLGVTGAGGGQTDNSWWILEGDEELFVDGERRPSWHGTGLEDYFNGGWYYRGAAFAALHGILDRAPFRVAQFRHHLVDPVRFRASFRMTFERGDRNVSHGWFQSTAFAYLDAPRPVHSCPVSRDERRANPERYERQTMMLQLVELERMNNFRKALDLCVEYQERQPGAEENGLYALRAIEYRRLLGEPVAREEYQPFLDGAHGSAAAEQAKLLAWFHERPDRALIGLYASGQGRLFLDGTEVAQGDDPHRLFVSGVTLQDGPHRLAAQVGWRRPDAWFQAAVRTSGGLVGTGPGTRVARDAPADWMTTDSFSDAWYVAESRDVPRGVPDAPVIGGRANAFVLLQSKAYALGLHDWGHHRGNAHYRLDFSTPLNGWPGFAFQMSGLDR
jgi:hypothetical protein